MDSCLLVSKGTNHHNHDDVDFGWFFVCLQKKVGENGRGWLGRIGVETKESTKSVMMSSGYKANIYPKY